MTITDWPVSYEEIEPYYTQAEWEIGISGPNIKTPLIAPMSKPYPCRPLPLKSSGALIQKAAAKLNLTVTPNVAAIITEPYNGRSGCINCGACSGYGCQVKARSSSAVTFRLSWRRCYGFSMRLTVHYWNGSCPAIYASAIAKYWLRHMI